MDATEISTREILSSTRAGREAAQLAFSTLNNAGEGYDPTGDDLGALMRDAESTSDVTVYRQTDEDGDEWVILVGTDASGSDDSRWAVRVGDMGVTLSDLPVSPTDDDLETLRTEGAAHGDLATSALCTLALEDRPLTTAEGEAVTETGWSPTWTAEECRAECALVIAGGRD